MSTFFSTRAGRCIRLIMTVEHLHDSSARIIFNKAHESARWLTWHSAVKSSPRKEKAKHSYLFRPLVVKGAESSHAILWLLDFDFFSSKSYWNITCEQKWRRNVPVILNETLFHWMVFDTFLFLTCIVKLEWF